MKRTLDLFAACMIALAAACGTDSINTPTDGVTDGEDGTSVAADLDLDTISDVDEGKFAPGGPVDTDGDGTPDYLDADSDGDTIPDSMEAGDTDTSTPPDDADKDGIPNFRDLDSDGNGMPDRVEHTNDADRDGRGDWMDTDNDNDGLPDTVEMGDPASPSDADMDGIPDHLDTDSDNDKILDRDERATDKDGDGVANFRDLDSDGDGVPDEEEAGDDDPMTPPVDSDDDRVPDFLDHDSDGDGLGDGWEYENGTSRTDPDTDGDGTTDLIEVGAGTDPLDATKNPHTEGNFVFVVPFREDPEPTQDTLVFTTDIQKADVYFIIDTSGSMMGEVNNLRGSLQTTIVPGIAAEIPSVFFGVMRFEDCPFDCGPTSLQNLQNITGDIPAVQAALGTITDTCGGSEPYTQALFIAASGDGAPWGLPARTCTDPAARIGYPCFRDGSIPILIQMGDEDFDEGVQDCSPSRTIAQAVAAINTIGGKYIGVNSGQSRNHMIEVARGTGSVDIGGSPLVYDIPSNGTGLGDQVVDAVELLANQVPIEVSTGRRDDATDGICFTSGMERTACCCFDDADAPVACHDTARASMGPCAAGDMFEPVDAARSFIEKIVPNAAGGVADPVDPAIVCLGGLATADRDADTVADVFTGILPGTPVCFDIYALQNEAVESIDAPQTFLCEIDVIGDGVTVLSTRKVYFLVPPIPIVDVPE